jgi:hypothetical protein
MRTMFWSAITILSSLLVSARGQEITIYPSFAEVRQPVAVSGNRFDWTPPADLHTFLIPGSLELSDASVTALNVLSPPRSILALYEGKEVKVRFRDAFVTARVVNADTFLFEIEGAFIQLPGVEVLYPNLDGVRYAPTFSWERSGENTQAQLKYATVAVAWQNTRYTLDVQDSPGLSNPSSLTAWAEIVNQSGVVYEVPKATLFAGDLNLESDGVDVQQAQQRNINAFGNAPASNITQRPRVVSSGEVGGLQRFEYAKPLRLEARSLLSLPFIRSSSTVRRILEYINDFESDDNFKVALLRTYRFVAQQGFPAGIVTIREDGQLVGQARLENTAKDTIVKLSLGKDFDINLNRSAQILERTDKRERAQIVFTVKNTKSRAVTVRLVERLDDRIKLEVKGAQQGFKRVPGAFTLEAEIVPGKTLNLTLLSTRVF